MKNKDLTILNKIQDRIYTIRGIHVMLDRDLAELYGVETKVLNQAVKRNIERFPDSFMFQMSNEELENWKSQFVTSNKEIMGLRKKPWVFTEQGVAMLAGVLKSKIAVGISIRIIKSFVKMRNFLNANAQIFSRLDAVETKQLKYQLKTDENFEKIFKGLEDKSLKPKQGIFYDGQIFDAYVFVADLIKSAKKSIVLVDNYVDESVLHLFRKRKKKVAVTIYTKQFSKILKQDLEKYNKQYSPIEIKTFKKAHDRFMIIDEKEIYHIGASLKDLGKKWFAFSKFDEGAVGVLNKLK